MARRFLALTLCVTSAMGLLAQQRVAPPPAATGTSRLAGRVVTMDSAAQPVRNAIVTLTAPELPEGKSTMTDDAGGFAFANLSAGRFTITASKAAHIATSYGAKRPGRPGTPLSLSAGQQMTDLTVQLARGAVITGRVADRAGQPVSMVQVTAIRADLNNAPGGPGGTTRATETFVTDDRGVYRLFGLEPGTYLVASVPRVTGTGDLEVMSSAAIDAALAKLQARGPASSAAPAAAPAAIGAPAVRTASNSYGFPPVFYPGTASATDAVPVTLTIGEERSGADIVLEPVSVAAIEGVITTTDGFALSNVSVTISTGGPPMPETFGSRPVLSLRPGADGRFRFTGVAPGVYTVMARTAVGAGQSINAAPGGPQFASETITVAGDIQGVTLALRPMPSFAGKVVFDGTTLAAPADLTRLRVTIAPPTLAMGSGVSVIGVSGTMTVALRADGTFQMPGVMPGSYRVTLPIPDSTPGTGWWLRSATVGGRDVLDTLLDLGSTSVGNAVLTFSDRHTALSGRLQSPGGQPASDCFIVVFSTDRAVRKPLARRVQSTRPGTDGVFSFRDLPAGEYFVAALNDVDQDEWRDPAFLAEIAAAGAIKVTLGDGENKVQDLRIGG